jgi:hypothetical protein
MMGYKNNKPTDGHTLSLSFFFHQEERKREKRPQPQTTLEKPMLAQNFKSAEDLGISEKDRNALMKVLVMMETGKMTYVPGREVGLHGRHGVCDGYFSMNLSFGRHECGTTNCIRGAAIAVGGAEFQGNPIFVGSGGLEQLFYQWVGDPNVEQGARALRNYLTCGFPKWKEVMSMEMNNG